MKVEVYIGDWGEGLYWTCPFCGADNLLLYENNKCKCGAVLEIEAHQPSMTTRESS